MICIRLQVSREDWSDACEKEDMYRDLHDNERETRNSDTDRALLIYRNLAIVGAIVLSRRTTRDRFNQALYLWNTCLTYVCMETCAQ